MLLKRAKNSSLSSIFCYLASFYFFRFCYVLILCLLVPGMAINFGDIRVYMKENSPTFMNDQERKKIRNDRGNVRHGEVF